MIPIPAVLSRPAHPLAALTGVAVAVLAFGLAAPAIGAEDEPRLLTVQFDLVDPDATAGTADGPLSASTGGPLAHYTALQVDHAGVSRRLRPLVGPTAASPATATPTVAAEIDGLRVGSAAEEFDATLADVFASPAIDRFARLAGGDGGGPATVDVRLPRPLAAGDYLLVQEAGGDATSEIEAIAGDGRALGPTRVIGPPYRWNSGYTTSDGLAQWATVVDGSSFGRQPVSGLRIRSTKAEVKVLVLEPDVEQPTGGQPTEDRSRDERPPGGQPATETVPSPNVAPSPAVDEAAAPVERAAAVPARPAADPVSTPAQVSGDDGSAVPTTLAMTGMPTEPWILVGLATGLIFFGYTAVAAFRRPADGAEPGEPRGHANLDALGFD